MVYCIIEESAVGRGIFLELEFLIEGLGSL